MQIQIKMQVFVHIRGVTFFGRNGIGFKAELFLTFHIACTRKHRTVQARSYEISGIIRIAEIKTYRIRHIFVP